MGDIADSNPALKWAHLRESGGAGYASRRGSRQRLDGRAANAAQHGFWAKSLLLRGRSSTSYDTQIQFRKYDRCFIRKCNIRDSIGVHIMDERINNGIAFRVRVRNTVDVGYKNLCSFHYMDKPRS
jgi:hypothetical protein